MSADSYSLLLPSSPLLASPRFQTSLKKLGITLDELDPISLQEIKETRKPTREYAKDPESFYQQVYEHEKEERRNKLRKVLRVRMNIINQEEKTKSIRKQLKTDTTNNNQSTLNSNTHLRTDNHSRTDNQPQKTNPTINPDSQIISNVRDINESVKQKQIEFMNKQKNYQQRQFINEHLQHLKTQKQIFKMKQQEEQVSRFKETKEQMQYENRIMKEQHLQEKMNQASENRLKMDINEKQRINYYKQQRQKRLAQINLVQYNLINIIRTVKKTQKSCKKGI